MGGLCSKDDADDSSKKRNRYAAKDDPPAKRGQRPDEVSEDDAIRKGAGAGAATSSPAASPPAAAARPAARASGKYLTAPQPAMVPEELVAQGFRQYPPQMSSGDEALAIAAVGTSRVLFGGEDKTIHCADIKEGNIVRTWKSAHKNDVNRITQPHPTTGLFMSCSRDATAKAWKIDEPEVVQKFEGHSLNVSTVTQSPDGSLAVTGSRDNSVRLWDVETGDCLSCQDIKLNIVHFCRWIPALNVVAQGGEDLTVRLWDIRDSRGIELSETLADFDYHPICSALVGQPESTTSLYTGHNGFNGKGAMVTEWDLRMRKQVRHFHGHRGTVRWLKEVEGQNKLLSCSDDGSLRVWNLNTGGLDASVHFPEGGVTCCDQLDDNGMLVFSCRTGCIVGGRLSDLGDSFLRERYIGIPGNS